MQKARKNEKEKERECRWKKDIRRRKEKQASLKVNTEPAYRVVSIHL